MTRKVGKDSHPSSHGPACSPGYQGRSGSALGLERRETEGKRGSSWPQVRDWKARPKTYFLPFFTRRSTSQTQLPRDDRTVCGETAVFLSLILTVSTNMSQQGSASHLWMSLLSKSIPSRALHVLPHLPPNLIRHQEPRDLTNHSPVETRVAGRWAGCRRGESQPGRHTQQVAFLVSSFVKGGGAPITPKDPKTRILKIMPPPSSPRWD